MRNLIWNSISYQTLDPFIMLGLVTKARIEFSTSGDFLVKCVAEHMMGHTDESNDEIFIMKEGSVSISTTVAKFGNVKYPIGNITSYRTETIVKKENGKSGDFWGIVGIAISFTSGKFILDQAFDIYQKLGKPSEWWFVLVDMLTIGNLGLLALVILGIYLFIETDFFPEEKKVMTYKLLISSAGGENQVYTTQNKEFVQRVENAIDAALQRRQQ